MLIGWQVGLLISLPFVGTGGFVGDVVDHPIDLFNLADDGDYDALQHFVGDGRIFKRHHVRGSDSPQGNGLAVYPGISFDAGRFNTSKNSRGLPVLEFGVLEFSI